VCGKAVITHTIIKSSSSFALHNSETRAFNWRKETLKYLKTEPRKINELTETKQRHEGENFAINCILIYIHPINQIQERIWIGYVARMEKQKGYWIASSVLTASSQPATNTSIFVYPSFIRHLNGEKWNCENMYEIRNTITCTWSSPNIHLI
jgi:hypothetical protein